MRTPNALMALASACRGNGTIYARENRENAGHLGKRACTSACIYILGIASEIRHPPSVMASIFHCILIKQHRPQNLRWHQNTGRGHKVKRGHKMVDDIGSHKILAMKYIFSLSFASRQEACKYPFSLQ
jgi:hypothetical protein